MIDNIDNLTPLQKAHLRQKELREAGVLNRTPVEKFIDRPRLGRAVKMFCYECNGYSRAQANTCPDQSCPLWLFRKGKSSPDANEVPGWQQAYAAKMKSVDELNKAFTPAPWGDDPTLPDDEDDDDADSIIEPPEE